MKKTRVFLWFVVMAILFPGMPIFSQEGDFAKENPALCLDRTEVRNFHSVISGLDYELWISLPVSYFTREGDKYPVIYTLDPYRAFAMMKGLTDVLSFPTPLIDEVIIVGVGYGGEDQAEVMNWALGRTRDYTPVYSPDVEELYKRRLAGFGALDVEVQTGGAPQFLEFIGDELVPFIESNYRTESQKRMFAGYSMGGLFGTFVLFHQPELFSKYFLGSPSLHFSNGISFEYENSYASQHSDLKAEVLFTVGALEERTSENVLEMEKLLNSRNYENLQMNVAIFEGENHVSCYPGAISRALTVLLGK